MNAEREGLNPRGVLMRFGPAMQVHGLLKSLVESFDGEASLEVTLGSLNKADFLIDCAQPSSSQRWGKGVHAAIFHEPRQGRVTVVIRGTATVIREYIHYS